MDTLAHSLATRGFAVVSNVIDEEACEAAATGLGELGVEGAGSRRLLTLSWCAQLAQHLKSHNLVGAVLPPDAVAVQCTAFTKSPTANWLVSIHQDRSIPVSARVPSDHLTGWSEKEGSLFVQPPAEVLERITAVRLHIDPCTLESGPLRLVPASHNQGVLSAAQVEQLRERNGEQAVPAPRGGALIMKPLVLHASSKATAPMNRRILHFVFGPPKLPYGLKWQYAI